MDDLQKGQVALDTLFSMKADVEQRCINLAIENAILKARVAELEATKDATP